MTSREPVGKQLPGPEEVGQIRPREPPTEQARAVVLDRCRIVEVDPELLLPYLLERRGRNQDHVLELLTAAIGTGQSIGRVRSGDPELMARTLLLAVQGFVISLPTMTDTPTDELDRELAALVERYLRP